MQFKSMQDLIVDEADYEDVEAQPTLKNRADSEILKNEKKI